MFNCLTMANPAIMFETSNATINLSSDIVISFSHQLFSYLSENKNGQPFPNIYLGWSEFVSKVLEIRTTANHIESKAKLNLAYDKEIRS